METVLLFFFTETKTQSMYVFSQFQLSRVRKELNLVKPIFSAILFDLLQNAVDKLIRERRAKNVQHPNTFPLTQRSKKVGRKLSQNISYILRGYSTTTWTNLDQILVQVDT